MADHILNLTSLIISLVALVVSLYSWGTSSRAARNDVLAQVRDWGGEVVELLAEAGALCILSLDSAHTSELIQRRTDLRARASSLLDRGRFFFPNSAGIRPQILDVIVLIYELLPGIGEEDNCERRKKGFYYLQAVLVNAMKEAVNFNVAPSSIKKYEVHLANIQVQPLPLEILEMLERRHDFELGFDERSVDVVPSRDPASIG